MNQVKKYQIILLNGLKATRQNTQKYMHLLRDKQKLLIGSLTEERNLTHGLDAKPDEA